MRRLLRVKEISLFNSFKLGEELSLTANLNSYSSLFAVPANDLLARNSFLLTTARAVFE